MNVATTEINYDIDGSVMSVCVTEILMEGVKVETYRDPVTNTPREIALYIGDSYVEMNYSDELAAMFGNLGEVSALELLSACQRNLWIMGAPA